MTFGCGCTRVVWNYCPKVKEPKVYSYTVNRKEYQKIDCDHLKQIDDEARTNCCCFGCCVKSVKAEQSAVRTFEAAVVVMPGNRYPHDFKTEKKDSTEMVTHKVGCGDMQSYSLLTARHHLQDCAHKILPGQARTQGYVTDAVKDLGSGNLGGKMTVEQQREAIWNAFTPDIAYGIMRGTKVIGVEKVSRTVRTGLPQLTARARQGHLIQYQIFLELMFAGLLESQRRVNEDSRPPKIPQQLNDVQKAKRSGNERVAADANGKYQEALRIPEMLQYRALFISNA